MKPFSLPLWMPALLTLPIASTVALANPCMPPDNPGNPPGNLPPSGGNPLPPPLQRLNLTAEQQKKIQTILSEERSGAESLMQQLRQADEKMRSLLAANASADELRKQNREVQRLRQAMDERRFEVMLKMREVLTPEQRAKLAADRPPGPPQPPAPPAP
ncbi:hypothetical protein BST81_03585 [Leptolyngbya sp. 'hensonii']|uniref:Spy/CpxP family protein refolding chaperone n=1 Tax=Leptolyngbya sp. 'hensonii' TaxID=1922337 RepID=UPI00094F6790|nr:Spy/CpxP family protein refolding chaperone [Leptolyngbya sp. 'hensonii']OLP19638.1 hypothetical protein BST81_03585 [Leptolyngbya sp. 'hensonii']